MQSGLICIADSSRDGEEGQTDEKKWYIYAYRIKSKVVRVIYLINFPTFSFVFHAVL